MAKAASMASASNKHQLNNGEIIAHISVAAGEQQRKKK